MPVENKKFREELKTQRRWSPYFVKRYTNLIKRCQEHERNRASTQTRVNHEQWIQAKLRQWNIRSKVIALSSLNPD